MNENYKDYYIYLEELRQSGIINMFGAVPYLQREFYLSYSAAKEVLLNWMQYYGEISEKYYR